MLTLLAVVHVLIGLALVLFVLLQDPKGGAMGVFSGGSSANTFFGSSGASNFLTTTTKWLAILFAASCLTLTYLTAKQGSSVMDNVTPGGGAASPHSASPSTPPATNANSNPAAGAAAPTSLPPATQQGAPTTPQTAPPAADPAKH